MTITHVATVISATLIIGAGVAPAETADLGTPAATAVRLERVLGDGAWARAEPITAFVQRDPAEGAPATEATEVRVMYDATHLYVSVRAFDRDPSRIVALRTRRDEPSPSDWIRVFVDSYYDRRTAYEFAVNPAGVKQDRYWFADTASDASWDAVWDVSVATDADGWRAEFRIPLSQLRFDTTGRDRFGFAVEREIGRLNEISSWPLITKTRPGFVSQFGELGGLEPGAANKRMEVMPYVVGTTRTEPVAAGDPFVTSPDSGGAIGLDARYAVTPGLTLTTTINPDFGQVEADPAVVNLTAFETFYEERRPFFVEGSGAFKFDLDCNNISTCTGLFYSRRIGRLPQGSVAAPAGGYVSAPGQTTILGAAKLAGRVGAFSIGAMNAVTSRERARVALGTTRASHTVEPLSNYAVVQARREWPHQSSLGLMFTSVTREGDADTRFLATRALAWGVNWDRRLKDPRYAVQGYWVGSAIAGSAEAIGRLQANAVHLYQRVDASHLDADPTRSSLAGHAGQILFTKPSGRRLRFGIDATYKTPGFDVNDLGYMRRADTVGRSVWVQFRWDTPTRAFRALRMTLNESAAWNFDGDLLSRNVNVNAVVTFPFQWYAAVGLTLNGRGVDDRAARGGPAFTTKRTVDGWITLRSDARKAVSGFVQDQFAYDEAGSSRHVIDGEMTWRPAAYLAASGGWHVELFDEDTQWVTNVATGGSTRYLFGGLRQRTVGLTARVNYTLTPNLTVQVYGAPFVSAGAYRDFKALVRPRQASVAAQFDPVAFPSNPDFDYRSFRMTNVLRWEYRPGSVIYVMWQQGREAVGDDGRFRFGREFGRVFATPGSNVFLVKASYWLNF